MKFTFGIVTSGPSDALKNLIASIVYQNLKKYEIIVVGGQEHITGHNLTHIPFDETATEKGWITRKKNLITQAATYENIVYLHDYFILNEGWAFGWEEWVRTNSACQVATNCISTAEGYRHSDWVVDPYLLWEVYPELHWKYWDVALPYDVNYTPIQYISGNFWVATKQFMLDNPLDETLFWGDSEDIEWSKRVRRKTKFGFNPNSLCTITKPGKWAPGIIPDEYLAKLKSRFL